MGNRASDLPISWLMEKALERPSIVSLAAGFTDNPTLPVQFTREVVDEVLGDNASGQKALQYGTTRGDDRLRARIASLVDANDRGSGVSPISASNVVVTHGSQQFLYLFCELMLDEGDIVIVEDPTYFVILGLFKNRRIDVRGVPVGESGIDMPALEELLESLRSSGQLHRLKFFYGVTYFQNPSGLTTPSANKLEVLDLLEKYESHAGHRLYYLEDAAYMHLGFDGQSIPTAMSFEKHRHRIVFSSTFSKPYATGLRVGYGILPEDLVNPLLFIKTNHDFGTANLLQCLMVVVLESGRYDSHLTMLRQRYRDKCQLLDQSMREHFPEWAQWVVPDGGLYIWVQLPDSIDTCLNGNFFKTAFENDVLYVPGGLCFAGNPDENGGLTASQKATMRLSFGGASEKSIALGAQRLGNALNQMSH